MALERLERHMAKVIRAVLRGGGDSNAASLPDTFVSTVKPDSRKDTEDGEEVLSHKRYDSALRR
jgi:hypothetical protein